MKRFIAEVIAALDLTMAIYWIGKHNFLWVGIFLYFLIYNLDVIADEVLKK